jgi:hypothetical protein
MKKSITDEELNMYIKILEDYNESKYKDYKKLVDDLLIEFGVKVTKERILELEEINLLVEDVKIIYDKL